MLGAHSVIAIDKEAYRLEMAARAGYTTIDFEATDVRSALLQLIETGQIDPTRIITHRLPLDQAPHGYEIFKNKQDNCEKIIMTP